MVGAHADEKKGWCGSRHAVHPAPVSARRRYLSYAGALIGWRVPYALHITAQTPLRPSSPVTLASTVGRYLGTYLPSTDPGAYRAELSQQQAVL